MTLFVGRLGFASDKLATKITNQRPAVGEFQYYQNGGFTIFWQNNLATQSVLPTDGSSTIFRLDISSSGGLSRNDRMPHFLSIQYDVIGRTLIVESDALGSIPFYYYRCDDEIVFANDHNLLFQESSLHPKLRPEAIIQYFTLGTILDNCSPWENIAFLPADHILTLTARTASLSNKYSWSSPTSVSINDLLDRACDALRTATLGFVETFHVDHAYLTGGADTRLVFALLPQNLRQRFTFQTVNVKGNDVSLDQDTALASRITQYFAVKHLVTEKPPYKLTMSSLNPTKKILPVLTGLLGGEFLGGDIYRKSPLMTSQDFISNGLEFFRHDAKILSQEYIRQNKNAIGSPNALQYLIQQTLRCHLSTIYGGVDQRWQTPNDFFPYRLSPFKDIQFISVLTRIPVEEHINYRFYGNLYRRHFAEFIQFPCNSRLAYKNKGFVYSEEGTNSKITQRQQINYFEYVQQKFCLDYWSSLDIFAEDALMQYFENSTSDSFNVHWANLLQWTDSHAIRVI